MLRLFVSHQIFLNRKQRYNLHKGEKIDAIGVNSPVWYKQTGEPRNVEVEVFCEYILTNLRKDYPIGKTKKGYQINLPQLTPEKRQMRRAIRKIDDVEWAKLNEQRQEMLYSLLESNSSENLLDYRNGGSKFIMFDQQCVQRYKKKKIEVTHLVQIKDLAVLTRTFSY